MCVRLIFGCSNFKKNGKLTPIFYLIFADTISVGERSTIFPGKRQCVRERSRCSPLVELSRDDNDAAMMRRRRGRTQRSNVSNRARSKMDDSARFYCARFSLNERFAVMRSTCQLLVLELRFRSYQCILFLVCRLHKGCNNVILTIQISSSQTPKIIRLNEGYEAPTSPSFHLVLFFVTFLRES